MMSMVERIFLLCFIGLVANVGAGLVVPYNDSSRINEQKYQFSADDRLINLSKAIPEWPYYGRLFRTSSHGRCEVSVVSARDGFSSEGNLCNSAGVWFSKNPVKFKDICVLSRLVSDNKMWPVAGHSSALETEDESALKTAHHYLRFLSDHDLLFNASTQKQQILFKYAHSCWDDLFYFGFEAGLVRAAQTLAMQSSFSTEEARYFSYENYGATSYIGTIYAANDMSRDFPNGLKSVFDKLLFDKKLSSDLNDEAVFVGDTKFFINIPLKVESINAASLSFYVSIPSPQQDNQEKIIQAFVGDPHRGLSFGAAAGFSWNISSLLNMHFFSYAQYSVPRIMARRVPRLITRSVNSEPPYTVTGSEAPLGVDTLPLPITVINVPFALTSMSYIDYRKTANFSLPDSSISLLADGVRSINIRRGPEVGVQVGNVFEDVFLKGLQLDASYKFKFKANDVLGPVGSEKGYDRESVVKNSFNMSHVFSATLNYEYLDSINFFAGVNYTIAGRNQLKDVSASFGMGGIF